MENGDAHSTVFDGFRPTYHQHLKPLSVYSRMIACDQKASVNHFCNPFINFKVEISNNHGRKRKLDDSCLDESISTPAKKVFAPQTLSLDLGYVVDSPPASTSEAEEEVVHSLLCSEHVDCGDHLNLPRIFQPEKVPNLTPAFDLDVDGILCLNHLNANEERASDSEEKCKIPDLNAFPEVTEAECQPESCQKEMSPTGKHSSFMGSYSCVVLNEPQMEPLNIETLEGDVEELWDIGLPLLESSVCHSVTVKLNTSDQSRQVSAEVQGGMMEPIRECQAESTLDTTSENTMPLQVKVKSVVVPVQHPPSSKPAAAAAAAAPLSKQTAKPTESRLKVSQPSNCSLKRKRPVVFDRKKDLEKDVYFNLVNRHMNDNPGRNQDVMTELLNLMTHVADRTPGSNNPQWQHPSDLTRRNYQQQFGNLIPSMALHEWQNKNNKTNKRFANVPKIFQRSPFP